VEVEPVEPGVLTFDAGAFASFEDFDERWQVVRTWRAAHAYPLRMASANLRHYGRQIEGARVTQRLKKLSTVIDKLTRLERMRLSRMEDLAGCRIVVPTDRQAAEVTRRLRRNWTVRRYRDYVAKPKDDGYRARHLVAVKQDRFVEVQVRSALQDLWANTVERDGRRLGVGLKFGGGDAEARERYRLMSELMAADERGEVASHELLDLLATVSDFSAPPDPSDG
jgi:hypothetical protein